MYKHIVQEIEYTKAYIDKINRHLLLNRKDYSAKITLARKVSRLKVLLKQKNKMELKNKVVC